MRKTLLILGGMLALSLTASARVITITTSCGVEYEMEISDKAGVKEITNLAIAVDAAACKDMEVDSGQIDVNVQQ